MDAIKIKTVIPAFLVMLFFVLCVYFTKKGEQGPWHQTVVELWHQEDWQKLRSLGENLHQVGKEDVESFYVAMLAAEQMGDEKAVQFFASLVSNSRVLNWHMERRLSSVYKPVTLRHGIALFRTRAVSAIAVALVVLLILSLRRKEPFQTAPVLLSTAGLLIFLL